MARGRGWRLLLGCAAGAVASWGVIVGRRWLRVRCRGRVHLHRRAYSHPRALASDLAAFWYHPTRLRRLRGGLLAGQRFLARLAVVAVRASQCTCLWSAVDWLAERLGLAKVEIARLGAGDLAVAEVAQVQALLFATRHGEEAGRLEEELIRDLHEAYGDEKAHLVRDWLDLVQIAVRVGYTWELALARLGGVAKGSALGPLVTVGAAVFGGLPLLAWALLVRAEAAGRELASSNA